MSVIGTVSEVGESSDFSLWGYVRDATSQRGEKMSRSAKGAVGSRDLAVRTQKMEGSI